MHVRKLIGCVWSEIIFLPSSSIHHFQAYSNTHGKPDRQTHNTRFRRSELWICSRCPPPPSSSHTSLFLAWYYQIGSCLRRRKPLFFILSSIKPEPYQFNLLQNPRSIFSAFELFMHEKSIKCCGNFLMFFPFCSIYITRKRKRDARDPCFNKEHRWNYNSKFKSLKAYVNAIYSWYILGGYMPW